MNEPASATVRPDEYVQDLASQWVAELVGAVRGDRVADLCAAPGGKATFIAGAGAWVVANDVRPPRAALVAANARWARARRCRGARGRRQAALRCAPRRSTVSWWMLRARASARCGGGPTPGGGSTRRASTACRSSNSSWSKRPCRSSVPAASSCTACARSPPVSRSVSTRISRRLHPELVPLGEPGGTVASVGSRRPAASTGRRDRRHVRPAAAQGAA